jgi:hypothetical protein
MDIIVQVVYQFMGQTGKPDTKIPKTMSKVLKTDKFRKTIEYHEVMNDETLQTDQTEITLSFCDQQSLHQVEVEFIITDKTRTRRGGR